MDGGDVEALDAHGRLVQGQCALQLQKRVVDALVVVVRAHLVAHERVLRVRLGHTHELGLLALLRRGDAHLRPVGAGQLFGEPCLHGGLVLGLVAQDDLVRDGRGGIVVAQQEHVQEVVVGHVLAAVEHELVGVDDAPFAHHEHVHPGHRLLAEQTHDVGVEVAR